MRKSINLTEILCATGLYTAEIKVGNKQLKVDGGWSKNQSTNDVHVPIKGK